MHSGNRERLGLVEEAQQKRARYGRYAYRAPASPPLRQDDVDLQTAEIRARIDKRREEIIAAHIEAEARREADAELAQAKAIRDRLPGLDSVLQLAAEITHVPVPALKGQRRADPGAALEAQRASVCAQVLAARETATEALPALR